MHAFLILTAAIIWIIGFHLTVGFYSIRFDTSFSGIKLSKVVTGNCGKYLFLRKTVTKKATTNVILMLKHQIIPKIRFMVQNLHILHFIILKIVCKQLQLTNCSRFQNEHEICKERETHRYTNVITF